MKIEKGEGALAFLFLYRIGLQHYVTARVALENDLEESGCLLAHQSIETLVKAIARLEPEKEQPWGHDLAQLLKETVGTVPQFKQMLENQKLINFFLQLSNAYKWKRYGEAKSDMDIREIIQLLDEAAAKLKQTYLATIKAPPTKLYVPEKMRGDFLKDNKCFGPDDISAGAFGFPGMPEMVLPSKGGSPSLV